MINRYIYIGALTWALLVSAATYLYVMVRSEDKRVTRAYLRRWHVFGVYVLVDGITIPAVMLLLFAEPMLTNLGKIVFVGTVAFVAAVGGIVGQAGVLLIYPMGGKSGDAPTGE